MAKCNFCNTETKESNVYDSLGRSVEIYDRRLLVTDRYREYAGGMLQTQQSSLPINFCPMCGRALEQGEE